MPEIPEIPSGVLDALMVVLAAAVGLVAKFGGAIWCWISGLFGVKPKETTDQSELLGMAYIQDVEKCAELAIKNDRANYGKIGKESRAKARQCAEGYVNAINIDMRDLYSRLMIDSQAPEAYERDIDLFEYFGETLTYEIVGIIMSSVELNHYATLTEGAWDIRVNAVIDSVGKKVLSWYGKRHRSNAVPWKAVVTMIEDRRRVYDDYIRATMARLKVDAHQTAGQVEANEKECNEIKARYADCIIRAEKKEKVVV